VVGPGVARPQGKSLRVVLFGDGQWAADTVERLAPGPHRVVGVVLRVRPTDATLDDAARRAGIPVKQFANVNGDELRRWLDSVAPDINLSIAFDQIVRRPLLEAPPHGFLNIHAGKLPAYRGRNVVNWAIINGETEIGLTAHLMDEGIDTGDILLQRVLPIGWTDGYGDVLRRVTAAVPALVVETLDAIAAGTARRHPQDPAGATYFGGRQEGDEWLDWSEPSHRLHNKIRAITRPGPGARTTLEGDVAIIWQAFFDPAWPKYIATPGQVVGREQGGVLVKTGDSTLLVREVQLASRAPETPSWRVGTRLGVDIHTVVEQMARRMQRERGERS